MTGPRPVCRVTRIRQVPGAALAEFGNSRVSETTRKHWLNRTRESKTEPLPPYAFIAVSRGSLEVDNHPL